MEQNKKIFLVILLSIIILATTIFTRINIESGNKVIDVVLDYVEMNEMASQSDNELKWWFGNFKNIGVKYVGLHEENLESMIDDNKDVEVVMGWELLRSSRLKELYVAGLESDYEIGKYDVLVNTGTEKIFNFIYDGLNKRYEEGLFEILSHEEGRYAILLKGTINDTVYLKGKAFIDVYNKGVALRETPYTSKLIKLGLGFDDEKIELIRESGLEVLPRPSNYNLWTTDKYIKTLLDDFKNFDMIPPVFIFTGDAVLGYPNYNYLVSEYMQDNDIKVGLIETSVQRKHLEQTGIEDLARGLEYNAVRIFSVWPYVQERFKFYNYEGAEEIENAFYRTVTERNIRLIYFKPFKENKVSFVTDFEEYKKMFDRFENRIAAHGMTIGRSSIMAPNRVRIAKQTLIGWGVVAAGVLLLSFLFSMNSKTKDILLILGMLAVPAIYVIIPLLMEKIMALAASIIFPSLAMVWVCSQCKKHFDDDREHSLLNIMGIGIKDLAIATAISALGGFFVAGILSNTEFLLEMDIFRGVKFSQIVPIILYGATYIAYFGYKNRRNAGDKPSLGLRDIKALLLEDVKIIYIILLTVLLVIGYVYIARTGHETNVQPSTLEMMVRNILEERLLARPRIKEFLIASPALMAAIYFAKNRYKFLTFIAGLTAVMGQASIANTFSHLRSPIYLSVMRIVYSLGLGIVLGVIYIAIIDIIFKMIFKLSGTGAVKERN